VLCAIITWAAHAGGPGINSRVTWECPGMDDCSSYEQIGYPDSIINVGATDAIVTHTLVGLPFGYNQPSHITMTDKRTLIVIYRSSGSGGGSEGGAGAMYCSRKPADSTWSTPIQIHYDSILSEGPNIYHIPGTDTTMAWYQTEAVYDVNKGWQADYLASALHGVRISTDDGVTWSDEMILGEIDRNEITDTAYNWFAHNQHHWNYTHRNPFVQLPNGDLAGFAGTAGDYSGNCGRHCRSCYIRIPMNNLLHMNPDGDDWHAAPIGNMDQWGCHTEGQLAVDYEHQVGHCGSLLLFDPSATHLGFIGRYNGIAVSEDAGETWTSIGLANGGGYMPSLQGGAASLDWWDTTSVLNGWHIRAGAVSKPHATPCMKGGWGIFAAKADQDSISEPGTWEEKLAFNHHYGTGWYDCPWGGFEDR
jgi:hypothetical protein